MSDLGTQAAPSPAAANQNARREKQPAGTWKVGSLSPTTVKVLTVIGFAIPVGAYLAMLAHYQVNVPFGDEWSQVHVLVQNSGHFPNWSSLWTLHTDNRMLFPNLIVIALAHTVSFNIEVEEYLGALMLFGAVALLIWAHKRRSPAIPLLYYCPVAFVMLTIAQWQNSLWGFQTPWFLVMLSLALSVMLLDRPGLTWPVLLCAALVAVVGSFSSIQGLLIWPTGLVLLYHRRRPAWTFVSWIAVGLATTALYFHNYHIKAVSSLEALRQPVRSSKLFLFALGDVVGVQTPHGPVSLKLFFGEGPAINTPGNTAVLLLGAVILLLAVFVMIRWGIHQDLESGAPIGIAMIVFGLLFAAFITDGRVLYGYWGMSQSRYTTYDVLVLVGIFLTALSRLPSRSRSKGQTTTRRRIDGGTVAAITLGILAIQLVFSIHYGIPGARSQHQADVSTITVLRNIDHESALTVYSLDLGESPQQIREDVEFLRAHHLSLYG